MPKQSHKQLRAIDAIGVLREDVSAASGFSAERTAVPLAGYFKAGGSSLRCDVLVDYGIALLAHQRSEASTILEFDRFQNPRMSVEGRQIIRALVAQYGHRITNCVKIPKRWVRIRNGLGVWLPQAILARIDGKRRFIIVQARRSCNALPRRASLYLSMFNNQHSVEDNRGVLSEVLDLQCSKGVTVRPRKVINSEDVERLSPQQVNSTLSVYSDAMMLIVKEPAKYGVPERWAETAQREFEFQW